MDKWETPTFIDVDMSAEIGGYQGDDPERGNDPLFPEYVAPAE